jgi:hypothetical protein
MVIAALITFAALVAAWLVAPSGRRERRVTETIPTLVPEAA